MEQQPPPPPHLQTVKLSTVIHRLVEKSYHELVCLTESLLDKPDHVRKLALRDQFQRTRHRLIRLLVLVKWSSHVPSVRKSWDILAFLAQQDEAFRLAADSLYWVSNTLKEARAPNYDIPTAIDVLTTGTYQRLPVCIKNLVPPPPITEEEEAKVLQRLNDVINMRLFTTSIPSQFSIRVADGRAYCLVKHEFQVTLTLEGEEKPSHRQQENDKEKEKEKEKETEPEDKEEPQEMLIAHRSELEDNQKFPWIVLSVDIFISAEELDTLTTKTTNCTVESRFSSSSSSASPSPLPMLHVNHLRHLLQRRMTMSPRPFEELYKIMHAVCVPMQMDILHGQVVALSRRQTGDIKIAHIPEKELTIFYWRNMNQARRKENIKPPKAAEEDSMYVQIKIEESDLVIRQHPPILHPITRRNVQLSLCPTSLNIERLLQQAITLHSYSLLENLKQMLSASQDLSFSANDIKLTPLSEDYTCQVMLRIRLFESYTLTVYVTSRTGNFALKAPSGMSEYKDILHDLETRLNKGSQQFVGIVKEFRHLAILDHFSRLANSESLRIEAFHYMLKGPQSSETSPSAQQHEFSNHTIYLRFRDMSDYYLAIELDETRFTPSFYLLTTKKHSSSLLTILKIYLLDCSGLQRENEPLTPLSPKPSLPVITIVPPPVFSHDPPSTRSFPQSLLASAQQLLFDATNTSLSLSSFSIKDKGKEKDQQPSKNVLKRDRSALLENEEDKDSSCTLSTPQKQKRLRTSSSTSRSTSNLRREIPYHMLLSSIVISCRRTITSMMLRQVFEEHKPGYVVDTKGDLIFSLPCEPPMKSEGMCLSVLSNFEWVIRVKETAPICETLKMTNLTPRGVNSHITYTRHKGWTFQYNKPHHDCLKVFWRDLRGVSRFTSLIVQLEQVLQDPTKSHLWQYFEVQRISPTHISLFFEERTARVTILWTPESNLVLSFDGIPGTLSRSFAFMLNTQRNIKELLEMLYRSSKPLRALQSFLDSTCRPKDSLLSSSLPRINASDDITLIARSLSQVRLVFRNICGVDIRFMGNQAVQIDDASMSLFQSPASSVTRKREDRSRMQLFPLIQFPGFFEKHIAPLVRESSNQSSPTSSSPSQQTIRPQQQQKVPTGLVTHAALPKALPLLHQFMGVLFLYRQIGPVLRTEVEDAKPDNFNIRFTVNRMTFTISIRDYCYLDLQPQKMSSGEANQLFEQTTSTTADAEITDEECSSLRTFFGRNVAVPPFSHRISCLVSFIRVLALPVPVFKQFAALISVLEADAAASASASASPSPFLIHLCLYTPSRPPQTGGTPAIVHDKKAQTVHFALQLEWGASAVWGMLPLTYRYGGDQPTLQLQQKATTTARQNLFSQNVLSRLPALSSQELLSSLVGGLKELPLPDLMRLTSTSPS
ncbi:Mediator of RNA polymerase II transcription subunit 14 [Balamuthia mandrillaris]